MAQAGPVDQQTAVWCPEIQDQICRAARGEREAAAVRSAKTWKGGERKTGKKKKKGGHAQMPVSTWKWSEPESTDLAHTRK